MTLRESRYYQVVAALHARGADSWITARELADALEVPVESVSGALADAARDGLLHRRRWPHSGRPQYRISEAGAAAVTERA